MAGKIKVIKVFMFRNPLGVIIRLYMKFKNKKTNIITNILLKNFSVGLYFSSVLETAINNTITTNTDININSSNNIESKGKNDKRNKERSIFGIPQEKTGKLIILLIITVVLYVIWIPAGLVFFGCVIGLWWDWRNKGLISCPDCGHHISKKAEACPKCGYPINKE